MRLFFYYAVHSFLNQLKKLFHTWVLVFILICALFGGAIGLFAGMTAEHLEEQNPAQAETQIAEEPEETFFEAAGIEPEDAVELAAGGLIFALFLFMAFGADKNGSRIFLPADVNLLFASPLKPQSVLMFRLTTQLGLSLLATVYMLIQLPNLTLNLGLSVWAAVAVIAIWGLTVLFATLLQVLLYLLASTYPAVKRFLRPGLYALMALIGAGYLLTLVSSGADALTAAIRFFNAPLSRLIPIWGWLKGFLLFAIEGNAAPALLCLAALLLGGLLLTAFIWRIKADFYEDAMAKSEETAELLERARSEKSAGILVKRTKERSEKLTRDGLRHGSGANVFFFKTMYNRFRFAHLRFFTKTAEFYTAAAVGTAVICRVSDYTGSAVPVALALAAMAFYRALGNSLEQDTSMDYFVLIPENLHAKLFWSLMGGTANCLLDAVLPLLIGALIAGANPFSALVWLPFIVSVDFYSTTVGTFIGLSVPVNAGKTVKQLVQVLFIYFGLLPDIAFMSLGILFDAMVPAVLGSAALNIGLGFLFFALCPLFLEPGDKAPKQTAAVFTGDLKAVRKQFSLLGLGAFAILASASLLQLAAIGLADLAFADGNSPSWLIWLVTFAPLYLAAVPLGLGIFCRVPASPVPRHSLKPGQIAAAVFISIFMMYAGNILGTLVTLLLQNVLGTAPVNPVQSYAADDSLWMKLLFLVILAPLIEEYVFRKQLIGRMKEYGERLAVVTSALIFGLFHGNLSQFFYAAALGLVFGYVYLKTGRLRYSAGLHMFINFLGSILAPAILNAMGDSLPETADASFSLAERMTPQLLLFLVYVVLLLACSLTGLVLLCLQKRRIRFTAAPMELPKGQRFRTVWLNPGMILFVLLCLGSVVLTVAV